MTDAHADLANEIRRHNINHRTTTEVPVPAPVLRRAAEQLRQCRDELADERRRHNDTHHRAYVLERQHGHMQVELHRRRTELATVLEIAEDNGLAITDQQVAEAIAARQRDDDEPGEQMALSPASTDGDQ